jgi:hypothetical protein
MVGLCLVIKSRRGGRKGGGVLSYVSLPTSHHESYLVGLKHSRSENTGWARDGWPNWVFLHVTPLEARRQVYTLQCN